MKNQDPAWSDYLAQAAKGYDDANYSAGLQGWAMRASHKLIERAHDPDTYFERVLEIGAGTGQHLPFVRHGFADYTLNDANPAALEIARARLDPAQRGKVRFNIDSCTAVSYPEGTFDRIIAVHVLEHIVHPHLALQEWLRVLKDGGVLSILIPTDPGFLWRMSRYLGPRRHAGDKGLAYDYIMAREHVNYCHGLISILRHFIPVAREAWWPLPVRSVDLNLFFAFDAVVRKSDPCVAAMSGTKAG